MCIFSWQYGRNPHTEKPENVQFTIEKCNIRWKVNKSVNVAFFFGDKLDIFTVFVLFFQEPHMTMRSSSRLVLVLIIFKIYNVHKHTFQHFYFQCKLTFIIRVTSCL